MSGSRFRILISRIDIGALTLEADRRRPEGAIFEPSRTSADSATKEGGFDADPP
jgi:hypothetical protein